MKFASLFSNRTDCFVVIHNSQSLISFPNHLCSVSSSICLHRVTKLAHKYSNFAIEIGRVSNSEFLKSKTRMYLK